MAANKLYNKKWLLITACTIGVACGVFAEGLWQVKIRNGPEDIFITQWLAANTRITKLVGKTLKIELRRIRSTYAVGFNNDAHGRYHYSLVGARAEMDVLVSWHKEPRNHSVVIDSVEPYGESFDEPIWRNSQVK